VTDASRFDPNSAPPAPLDLPEVGLAAVLQQVEVTTERAEGRQRQISATIQIPHAIEQVWQILTDYDRLADFVPNLSKSQQIEHPHGGVRVEQVGTQSFLTFMFRARVVLDMVETFPHQIAFEMVEGDFKSFSGSWQLEPVELANRTGTKLRYTVLVLPPRTMPVGLIERCVRSNLAVNLVAVQQRADVLFGAV
jgi:ribosome-associated toxin RatA of RatAB toxin-antitoxin module